MIDLRFQRPEDHLLKNQEYNREGYLFLIERSKKKMITRKFSLFFMENFLRFQIKSSEQQR